MPGRPIRTYAVPALALVAFSVSLMGARLPVMGASTRGGAAGPVHLSPARLTALRRQYARLPLRFEANRGQFDPRVQFVARGSGYTLFLTPGGAALALAAPQKTGLTADGLPDWTQPEGVGALLWLTMAGANTHASMAGLQRLHGVSNYFVGKNRRSWRAKVPAYARVTMRHVYPHIDVTYYGNQGQLEYDYTLAPGADPHRIKLDVAGAWWLSLDAHGNLIMHTAAGNFLQARPVIYQTIHGRRHTVSGGYTLLGPRRVGFTVGRYDNSKPLVIDPVLSYATYLGGSGSDYGVGIAVDSAGRAYVTGRTLSLSSFPGAGGASSFRGTAPTTGSTLSGGSDAFVTRLTADGSGQDFVTFLGGSSVNVGFGIAVDGAGNIVVVGATRSNLFPTVNAVQSTYGGGWSDAFVTKLNPAGNQILYSTYLGGSGWDFAGRVALDAAGDAYLTGATSSSTYPTANAAQPHYGGGMRDAFVTALSPSGTLLYSTYLGGSGEDEGRGIAVDSAGNAYVAGQTQSSNFPTMGALQPALGGSFDAFVTKLSSAGAIVYSTYLGGSDLDNANGVAVDGAGEAVVVGSTASQNFPTANAAQGANGGGSCLGLWFKLGVCSDAFITKLNANGTALVYSTYLGGSGKELGEGVALDSGGNAYVTGGTSSTNFPTSNPLQAANGGGTDAFVAKVDPNGSVLYSTYLGGSGYDDGYGLAADSAGNVFVTGLTTSTNFPTASPMQGGAGGGGDAFVAKISDEPNTPPTETPTATPADTATPTVMATLTPTATSLPPSPTPTETATPPVPTATATPSTGGCGPSLQPHWSATLTAIVRQTATAVAGATQTAVAGATQTAVAGATCTPVPTTTSTPTQ